ncbi:YcxB family protein [Thalassobellus suaedae]|uniref:YcxB family protein n=1 Tax=Thalassobellus suaedae TaxID=3074124 RepID=A0ABY9Y015_9FLAO|nr:YcxB family protein [Flavobacteriaceae bacterium HL-DH10]
MTLEYSLTNDDFLEHQLYEASKSKRIKSKRFKIRIINPVLFIILGIFSYLSDNKLFFPLIMLVFAVLWFFLYPIRAKKNHIKHYKNHIKDNYKNRIDKLVKLEFNENYIHMHDDTSESKIKTSEIKSLIELKNHFLLKLNTDMSLIIPKRVIENVNVFKEKISELKTPIIDELNWTFK